jgi:hypothetical protein
MCPRDVSDWIIRAQLTVKSVYRLLVTSFDAMEFAIQPIASFPNRVSSGRFTGPSLPCYNRRPMVLPCCV